MRWLGLDGEMITVMIDLLARHLKSLCSEKLSCYSLADIQPLFTMFAIHGMCVCGW